MSESSITKRVISNGFKELMQKKPFEKITISDIANVCGINRQTFYYHFQDKYDLLNQIFYNEAIIPFVNDLTVDNWSKNLLNMLTVVSNNSKFYINALHTSYSSEFQKYMHTVSTKIFSEVIDDASGKKLIENNDKMFIAEFFSYGIIGSFVAWVTKGIKEPPEVIVNHIVDLVDDCKNYAVKRCMNS